MEDRTMIIVGVIVLVIVLFVLLIIPASNRDILGTMGSDTINFNANSTPSPAPVPTITELQGQDLRVGTGSAEVVQGDTITVHYTGYFLDGRQFDSSRDREPFTITVGAGQVIPGFERGVVGMRVGGERRIFIPSDMAYGPQGSGAIPPNTAIAFDIELLSIDTVEVETEEPAPAEGEENAENPEESPTPTPEE